MSENSANLRLSGAGLELPRATQRERSAAGVQPLVTAGQTRTCGGRQPIARVSLPAQVPVLAAS
jgi:hypothetical protein